jgi:hypothetical protein
MSSCKVCNKSNENMQLCSACKSVRYCSRECQKEDWKSHKTSCLELGQVYLSDKAIETVFNNKPFNKMFQYIHHFHITGKNINDKLMLCLISPNFNKSNVLESYSCIINIAPVKEFSQEIQLQLIKDKRSVFFIYHDKLHYDLNSSKGSMISFNFEYEKRDTLCYEAIKGLDLPAIFTVYLDGRCE